MPLQDAVVSYCCVAELSLMFETGIKTSAILSETVKICERIYFYDYIDILYIKKK